MTPQSYDPVTFVHWLWWRLKCLEADGVAFEELFKQVAARTTPDFVPVRPYGNIGDRKCDGLLHREGVIYQLYSPDEMKQADLLRKAREDLVGAVEHWGHDLKKWVFVYNVRRGVAPDVPRLVYELRREVPDVEIEFLSNDQLWETVRDLPLQVRCEILGAPVGYEHLFLAPAALPEEVRERLRSGRFVVVQDLLSPVNVVDAMDALKPEAPVGPPLFLRPDITESWDAAAGFQTALVEEALDRSKDLLPRFAVFSLAPIPLAIQLGYLLSDRVEVRAFQFDRERATWVWDPTCEAGDTDFHLSGVPTERMNAVEDVVVRVALSGRIAPEDTELPESSPVQIDLTVENPNVMWLCHPDQLRALSRTFRDILQAVRENVPSCRRIHLFYYGPAPGAVVVGQAINPRMNPPVALYEYDHRGTPRYRHVLSLE